MTVLRLSDAKDHLNIVTDVNDDELKAFVDASVTAIENAIDGPIEARAVTATVTLNGRTVLLPKTPVISLTSVLGPGGAVDATALDVDLQAGVVSYWPAGTSTPTGWPSGRGRYTITYLAGYSPVPADLQLAVKELLRHLWATQRGGARRPGTQPSEALANTIPGAAYTWPIRVTQLLAPYTRLALG